MPFSESLNTAAAHLDIGEDPPLAVIPAAVPHYSLRISAICVERRVLPIIQEYILRAAACGFTDPQVVASFLGLDFEEVRREIALLEDEVFVSAGASKTLLLTEKGRKAISADGLRSPTVREVPCIANGVTRRVIRSTLELVPRRRLPRNTIALPAMPARPPRVGELEIHEVKQALQGSSSASYRSLEVSRLGRVTRTSTLFQPTHLMLRRGIHSVPTLAVDGGADVQLAKHLGGHPAIQQLKRQLSRQEEQVRHQLASLRPKLVGQGGAPPDTFREVLAAASEWGMTDRSDRAWGALDASIRRLASKSHWVGAEEFELLIHFAATSCATSKLLMVAAASELGEILTTELLERIASNATAEGMAEIHLPAEDLARISRDPGLKTRLRHVALYARSRPSGWCGVVLGGRFAAVGMRKGINSPLGQADSFFGTLFANATEGEATLRELSVSSVPVKVKRARRNLEDDRGRR